MEIPDQFYLKKILVTLSPSLPQKVRIELVTQNVEGAISEEEKAYTVEELVHILELIGDLIKTRSLLLDCFGQADLSSTEQTLRRIHQDTLRKTMEEMGASEEDIEREMRQFSREDMVQLRPFFITTGHVKGGRTFVLRSLETWPSKTVELSISASQSMAPFLGCEFELRTI